MAKDSKVLEIESTVRRPESPKRERALRYVLDEIRCPVFSGEQSGEKTTDTLPPGQRKSIDIHSKTYPLLSKEQIELMARERLDVLWHLDPNLSIPVILYNALTEQERRMLTESLKNGYLVVIGSGSMNIRQLVGLYERWCATQNLPSVEVHPFDLEMAAVEIKRDRAFTPEELLRIRSLMKKEIALSRLVVGGDAQGIVMNSNRDVVAVGVLRTNGEQMAKSLLALFERRIET